MTRRRWIAAGAAALVSAPTAVGLYTWQVEPHWIDVVHRPMSIVGLPTSWRGRRIVQISDIHVGWRVDSSYLMSAMRRIADLEPSLVVITGDFMTCDGFERVDEVARVMAALPRPSMGVVASFGNHDYAQGWQRDDVADRLIGRLDDLGIEVLRNESRMIDGLTVIGLDDLWAERFDPSAVTEWGRPGPRIALCHNPDAVDQEGWSDFEGWILAGHTHGGQCKPPFLPPPLLPVRNKRYTSGEFNLGDGRRLYINRGLGHLLQVRFNCRPEVTVFTLHEKARA